ncbi:hypothetical protein EQG49_06390 [Periweissella cryptocerci]|uniref:Uncharacterized protein n=1 Tax=Periweissella cryptocerci TaxID=2506420 RepID=A0A4P6YTT5_9LACO|nr:hypothetical protein [Periweissella cryptocerci]QBO36111.1 hypothetical protein EQG49_06390 [Periweissella cryptocerci]
MQEVSYKKISEKQKKFERANVTDDYFDEGKLVPKILQTLSTLLLNLSVLVPFVMTIWLVLYRWGWASRPLWNYREGYAYFTQGVSGFSLSAAVIAVILLGLNIYNKIKGKRDLDKESKIDYNRVNSKLELVEEQVASRFGRPEERQALKFVTIHEEDNIDQYEIEELFNENNVESYSWDEKIEWAGAEDY